MKKKIMFFVMMLVTAGLFSLSLNESAESLKSGHIDIYDAIKTRAIREWDDDHTMVVYEINKQSEALYEAAALLSDYNVITSSALHKWSDVALTSESNVFIESVDWVMVVYEAKKQIEAKQNY